VTLNISATQSAVVPDAAAASAVPAAKPAPSDRALVNDVIDELTSWNPREFIAAFSRWHHGAFSLIHLNVLMLLEAHGPMSMSHLAEALDISVASVTGVVDRMEKRGLVERRRDAEDRRVVLVYPAKGGQSVFGEIDARRRKGLAKLLEHLTDDDLRGLLNGHRALRVARAALAAAREGTNPPADLDPAGGSSR
jgi:DNA-binding MarR family transcriptional regulator